MERTDIDSITSRGGHSSFRGRGEIKRDSRYCWYGKECYYKETGQCKRIHEDSEDEEKEVDKKPR
jgi:hypothetical protein